MAIIVTFRTVDSSLQRRKKHPVLKNHFWDIGWAELSGLAHFRELQLGFLIVAFSTA